MILQHGERHGTEQGRHPWCSGKCLTVSSPERTSPWFVVYWLLWGKCSYPWRLRISSQLKTLQRTLCGSLLSGPLLWELQPPWTHSFVFSICGASWALPPYAASWKYSPGCMLRPSSHLSPLSHDHLLSLVPHAWNLLLYIFFRVF